MHFYANKFSIDIKKLLAHPAVHLLLEHHNVPVAICYNSKLFYELFLFYSNIGYYYIKLRLFFKENRVLNTVLYYKCDICFSNLTVPIGSIRDSLELILFKLFILFLQIIIGIIN